MPGPNAAGLRLTARFGAPHHGWLQLQLGDGQSETTLELSHTPNDPLRELAQAIRAVIESAQTATVRIHSEPTMHELALTVASPTLAVLSVTRVQTGRAVFAFKGDRVELCTTLWRALRRLESGFDPAQWQHPFPAADVAALTERLSARSA